MEKMLIIFLNEIKIKPLFTDEEALVYRLLVLVAVLRREMTSAREIRRYSFILWSETHFLCFRASEKCVSKLIN